MNEPYSDPYLSIIEAFLFVSEKPVQIQQIQEVLTEVSAAEIRSRIQTLKEAYEVGQRGIVIMEIADGWQMLSNPALAAYVRNFFKTRVKEKLSKPALEALAIIAYKQPVSRADIEVIRGVNSDGVVMHLLEKGLIKILGRKEVAGRPYLYGTTKQFLEYFGLKSQDDLPKLEDFPSVLQLKKSELSATESPLPGQTGKTTQSFPSARGPEMGDQSSPLEETFSSGSSRNSAQALNPEASQEKEAPSSLKFSEAGQQGKPVEHAATESPPRLEIEEEHTQALSLPPTQQGVDHEA